jgi:hypothetical protein
MIMSMMKTIGATVAAFVVQYGGDYLLHAVLLKPAYDRTPQLFRSDAGMMSHMWAIVLGELCFALGAVLIYNRGVESKSWAGQGLRFGILLAVVAVAPGVFISYATSPISHEIALHWMLGDGILAIIVGLVIAAICKPSGQSA